MPDELVELRRHLVEAMVDNVEPAVHGVIHGAPLNSHCRKDSSVGA